MKAIMSKFHMKNLSILFSLLFLSTTCSNNQEKNFPEAPETAIIKIVHELYNKVAPTVINRNDKEQESFLKKFREKIKKIAQKTVKQNPALYSQLVSDLEKISKENLLLSQESLSSDEDDITRITSLFLSTFTTEFIYQLLLFLPVDLIRSFTMNECSDIWTGCFRNALASSCLLSVIITLSAEMQIKKLNLEESCFSPELKSITPRMIFAIAIIIGDYSYNNKLLEKNFSSGTLAGWFALPMILYEVQQAAALKERAYEAQEMKTILKLLLGKYKELIKLEKAKEQSDGI